MAKPGPKRTSYLKHLLRRRESLRQRFETVRAEMSASTWPISKAMELNEKRIAKERKRRRELKKAASDNNT